MSELVEKLGNLGEEFEDDEFSSILDDVTDSIYDIINGETGPVGEMLDFLENYEEYNDNE